MVHVDGYVFVVRWKWRRLCDVFGKGTFMLGFHIHNFPTFNTLFEARRAQTERLSSHLNGRSDWIIRTWIAKLDLRIAVFPLEDELVKSMGSLVIAVPRHRQPERVDFRGGKGNMLIHFTPYKRPEMALRAQSRLNERGTGRARLVSWNMEKVHTHRE